MAVFRRSTSRDLRHPVRKWMDACRKFGLIALLSLAITGFILFGTAQKKLNHMEEELQQMVQGHLEAALSAYDGIDMRSANVEGVILPTMQEHLCYAQALDNAITNMFGAENEMFPAEVHQIFLNAMDEYRRAAKTGQSADRGRDTLDAFAEELRNTMTRHFDARGDLVQE